MAYGLKASSCHPLRNRWKYAIANGFDGISRFVGEDCERYTSMTDRPILVISYSRTDEKKIQIWLHQLNTLQDTITEDCNNLDVGWN